jgi:hypothetical protein
MAQRNIQLFHSLLGQTTSSYLLDDYGEDVFCAYSLRQLSSTYSGFCIEIRIVGPESFYNIGFVNGEVDTAEIISRAGSNVAKISKWYDQSGNAAVAGGFDCTTTYAPGQPDIFDGTSLITEHGKVSAKFYNGGQLWAPATGTINPALTNPSTHFAVVQAKNIRNNFTFISAGQDWGGTWTDWTADAGTTLTAARNHLGPWGELGTALFNGASSEFWVDGVSKITGNPGSDIPTVIRLGYLSTDGSNTNNFSEYIVYDADKSSDRVAIEANITDYYSF